MKHLALLLAALCCATLRAASVATLITDDDVAYADGVLAVGATSVELAAAADYSTNNTELVATVRAVAPTAPAPEPRRIAMFVIPVNAETNGTFAGFELKASTNNFSHAVEEGERLQFYAQGEIADTGEVGTNRWDRMKLFVCTTRDGDDSRSYHAISNTLAWTRQLTSVVALVDAGSLVRHPDGDWLREDNDELMWVYLRNGNNSLECESGTSRGLWRPVAPARWFRELPSWAR